MRVTVLGCGGFIASHLLDRLLGTRSDVEIEGWDPSTDKIAHHLGDSRLTVHEEATTAPGALARIEASIDRADVVVSLAAICNPAEYNTRPLDVIRTNLFDVYPLIEACAARHTWLIHFSTSEVYGRTLSSYLPDDMHDDPAYYELSENGVPLVMGPIVNQRWTYACAKQLAERVVYAFHREHGLPFTIIRPMNFFGPRMDFVPGRDGDGVPRVLACFMAALLDGEPMKLVDGGTARRTILSIHDAVDAIEAIIDQPERSRNQFFNVGSRDNEVTIAELAARMRAVYAEVAGDPRYLQHPVEDVPSSEFYGEGYEDCDRRMPDLTNVYSLGWRPTQSIDEILRETVSYYHHLFGDTRGTLTDAGS